MKRLLALGVILALSWAGAVLAQNVALTGAERLNVQPNTPAAYNPAAAASQQTTTQAIGNLGLSGSGLSTVSGAVKGNGSGTFTQAACADLSNGGTACSQAYTATTWTPAITASSTAGTPAYTTQVGSYEQIGRLVVARFTLVLSGWTGSPSGNVTITGLPIAATATANDNGTCYIGEYTIGGAAGDIGMSGLVAPSATVANLVMSAQTGTVNLTAAIAGSTPTIIGTCVYHS